MKTSSTQPRIAIIGGGLGGLVLARCLQTRGFAATLFELEASPAERSQGGILDMKADSGQIAIEMAGLTKEFWELARPEGQDKKMLDKTGQVLFEDISDEDDLFNPEIDRGQLRTLLLDSLAPGSLKWSHKLKSISRQADASHLLEFENGQKHVADLVVGADGAWSRVRSFLCDAQPEYTGVTFVELHFNQVDTQHPDIAKLVGRGSTFALADNKGLIAQRNSNGHVRVYAALRIAQEWANAFPPSLEEQRQLLLAHFEDWAAPLRALIEECPEIFIARPLFALPIPTRWAPKSGITLVGDAAHLMSPFAGMGANLAMLDGALLAEAITTSPNVDSAISTYEAAMFERAFEACTESAVGIAVAISADAPRGALEHFQRHLQPESNTMEES